MGRRALRAAAAAALLVLPQASRGGEEDAAEQARRADLLLSALLRDEGNGDLLRQAIGLREQCLVSGNHRTAELLAGQVVARRPGSLPDRHRYQRILVARGERENARRDLEELLLEVPSDCTGFWMLSDLLASTGDARGAREVHLRHLREHPGDKEAIYAAATIALRDLGDPEAARAGIAALRSEAAAPGAAAERAAWCRENADLLEKEAVDAERQAAALREHARRLDRWLLGAFAAALASLAAAFRATRPR